MCSSWIQAPAVPNLRRSLDQSVGSRQHLKHIRKAYFSSHSQMTRDPSIGGTEHSFCRAGGFVKGFRLSGDKVRSHPSSKSLNILNGEATQGYGMSRHELLLLFLFSTYLDSKLNELEARHSHEGLHGCAWQNPRKSIALATVGDLEGPSLHLVSPDFPTVSEFWMDMDGLSQLLSFCSSLSKSQPARLRLLPPSTVAPAIQSCSEREGVAEHLTEVTDGHRWSHLHSGLATHSNHSCICHPSNL